MDAATLIEKLDGRPTEDEGALQTVAAVLELFGEDAAAAWWLTGELPYASLMRSAETAAELWKAGDLADFAVYDLEEAICSLKNKTSHLPHQSAATKA